MDVWARAAWRRAVGALALAALIAGCGASTPPGSDPPASTAPDPASPTPEASAAASDPGAASAGPSGAAIPSLAVPQPLASSGAIAAVAPDGALYLVQPDGRTDELAGPGGGSFGFPTWSPDGTRVAAVRSTPTEATILIFEADPLAAAVRGPTVIFRSTTIGPFYLSWTPDGRNVSFLANEDGGLSLRIAPADGSAPLDGSADGARIRTGSPFYFDWIEDDRMLAHIGVGPEAFLGEIGLDGEAVGPALASPGDFRSAVVSPDDRWTATIRVADDDTSSVVVDERGGTGEASMPVFGSTALAFSPVEPIVAALARTAPADAEVTIPLGPLRLLDPRDGVVRTLIDGEVVSFWWSPDGRTIAAIRIDRLGEPPEQRTDIRLVFIDVETGDIRSEPRVAPSPAFINGVLGYFDQYALSHRLWSPDSTSFLLPVVADDGGSRIQVLFPDGGPSISIEGQIAFWSP